MPNQELIDFLKEEISVIKKSITKYEEQAVIKPWEKAGLDIERTRHDKFMKVLEIISK